MVAAVYDTLIRAHQTVLAGKVRRVIYTADDSDFKIALLQTPDHQEHKVVGPLPNIYPGIELQVLGEWTRHVDHGRQFSVAQATPQTPTDSNSIRQYLAHAIPGVGATLANRLVDAFGRRTLQVMQFHPERLTAVAGIGPQRALALSETVKEQVQVRQLLLTALQHGLTTNLALRIRRHFGSRAVKILEEQPYRLSEVPGIGFQTADKLAQSQGVASQSVNRIQAGIRYALWDTYVQAGHCYAPRTELVRDAATLLHLPESRCRQVLDAGQSALTLAGSAVYPAHLFDDEADVAHFLKILLHARRCSRIPQGARLQQRLAYVWQDLDFKLTPQQREAVAVALREPVSILTGGPGTGKTVTLRAVLQAAKRVNPTAVIAVAAPTGRAAKRITEVTGHPASTIHRLLGYQPLTEDGAYQQWDYGRHHQLPADMVIVDETSMVDISLMRHLVEALDKGTHLLLVGDADQLPSVGPGNVLRDLIASRVIPTTRLTTVHRQAADSGIIANAHRINQGQAPHYNQGHDFFMFHYANPHPEQIAGTVEALVTTKIPAKFGLQPADIQVLSPVYHGPAGVTALNQRLQSRLNSPRATKPELQFSESRVLRVGDRVMQIHNDYERGVFNGNQGRIIEIADPESEKVALTVRFADGRKVKYARADADALQLAYAMTIHKSQGGEFPAIVLVLLQQHCPLLSRNLLYTGLTRAQRLAILVGNRQAMQLAIDNDAVAQRYTRLQQRLQP
jgi:exodeoxyribonuclease V alpha subunit